MSDNKKVVSSIVLIIYSILGFLTTKFFDIFENFDIRIPSGVYFVINPVPDIYNFYFSSLQLPDILIILIYPIIITIVGAVLLYNYKFKGMSKGPVKVSLR